RDRFTRNVARRRATARRTSRGRSRQCARRRAWRRFTGLLAGRQLARDLAGDLLGQRGEILSRPRGALARVEPLPAEPTLDGRWLNVFSAEGTGLHGSRNVSHPAQTQTGDHQPLALLTQQRCSPAHYTRTRPI